MANYIDKVQNMLENSQNDAVVLKSATMKKYLNTDISVLIQESLSFDA